MAYYLCYLENSTASIIDYSDNIKSELEELTEKERYSIWSNEDINKLLNRDSRAPIRIGDTFRELFTDCENIESCRDYTVIQLEKQLYFDNCELTSLKTSLDYALKHLHELNTETEKKDYKKLTDSLNKLQDKISRALYLVD